MAGISAADVAKKAREAAEVTKKAQEARDSTQAARGGSIVTVGRNTAAESGSVDSVGVKSGLGYIGAGITQAYSGFNIYGTGVPAPLNNEHQGFTFFTRPLLNLSYDNITQDRSMTLMLTEAAESMPRAVRAFLDPVGAKGYAMLGKTDKRYIHPPHDSPLVDNNSAFLNVLSNTLLSLTGWPDPTVDTYTSKEGAYKESFSMMDGTCKMFGTWTMNASFRNIVTDPISYLMHVWTQYGSLVKEGVMDPRPELLLENEVDYMTRCYRFIMDPSRTYILKAAACGAAFPTANSLGAHFNFNSDKPFNRDVDQISVSFQCMGAAYYDPIILYEFNRVVSMFNPAMDALINNSSARMSAYVYIPPKYRLLFNSARFKYPRVNTLTSELEWWVRKDIYDEIMNTSDITGDYNGQSGYLI